MYGEIIAQGYFMYLREDSYWSALFIPFHDPDEFLVITIRLQVHGCLSDRALEIVRKKLVSP